MGVTQKAKDAHAKYKKYKKAKGYYDTVKKLLDEDTRSAEGFNQGLKYLIKIGEKVVPGLSKHPYYVFHKVHLEMLGRALTASDTHHNAMKALESAIASADAADGLTRQLTTYRSRKDALKLEYMMYLDGNIKTLREHRSNPAQAQKQLKDQGITADQLETVTSNNLFEWRGHVCDLYYDTTDLMAMVDIEYRAAKAAYKKFTEKVEKLNKSKKNIDRIAGKSAQYKRDLEIASRELDRIYNKKSDNPAPEAVADPSGHAKRQLDKVDAMVHKLATMCDVAMSDDAWNPATINAKIGGL